MKTKLIIIIMPTLLIVIFAALLWRLFSLQRYHIDRYRLSSQRQQCAVVTENPQRGTILDRRYNILAASNQVETLFAEPGRISDPETRKEVAGKLQQILDCPGHEICRVITESKNPGFVKIKTPVTPALSEAIKKAKIPGVGIRSDWQRFYPEGTLMSHVVGYVGFTESSGSDQTGCAGIELRYESRLKGLEGSTALYVDGAREPIGMRPQATKPVIDGSNLVLTIDATIQHFARSALIKQYTAYEAESAVAVVIDPWTGAILAMVSLPDFDPVDYAAASQEARRNCAITDPFEPGSIFKPIVAAIALDAGTINYNDIIFCEDGYFARYKIGEFLNHPYGNLSIKGIIAKSSNVGMAKIGLKTGKQKLYDGIKLFGFGRKTGIDLPGEDAGVFFHPDRWDGLTVTRLPFGHAISATTIQIIRAYCILANGGSIVTPHLVKAIIDHDGKVMETQPSSLAGQIIKPEVAKWIVQTALVAVVNEGTGEKAKLDNIQTFGKTGTANIAKLRAQGGGYDETNYIASFVGGAPPEKPKVIILVSIRKPNRSLGKGYSGGRVAAPVFKEILEKTLTYLNRD